jgi:hypothetical protein
MSIMMYSPSPNQPTRRGQITYPSPNEYFDAGAIYLLYNAFDMHRRADLASDLFAHLRKQLDAAQGAEKLHLHLAIAYLHWWSEEKDEALAELAKAIESAPGDHNLVLEVAALREQNSDFDAALTLLDSITPLDTQMMQRREDAALRVAERTGNLDRARQAADRLFDAVWDRLGATRAGAPDALTNGVPPRWNNASARAVWFAQDGYLVQAWGDQPSFLLFDTPLTGTFEISVDAFGPPQEAVGPVVGSGVGYADVVYDAHTIWPVGRHESIFRSATGLRARQFNRVTVQVTPGKVRCLVNGQEFFEDTTPPTTCPWVMLASDTGGRPVFRNFSLTGQPQVPAEVKLTEGDSLGGWMTHVYAGSMPQRLPAKEPTTTPQYYDDYYDRPPTDTRKERVYDWQAKGGELLGRKLAQPGERPVPSKLAYFRPLRPGETVRYEFFYEPGQSHAHPSLGRLAFLLEPDGVRLHWLTDKTGDDWTGLPVDSVIDDKAAGGPRATEKLPLKAGDWNRVTLATSADGVKIELNGTTVYEAKFAAEIERLFGFFHYRDRTEVRVRNVVLTGSWPQTFSLPDGTAFATTPASPAEANARRWQLGERFYFTEVGDVIARSKLLAAKERYHALAKWVLPNESRPSFQLAGVTKPLDVLGDPAGPKTQPTGSAGRRVMLGGRFEAPCLEMIVAAKEAGALDELAEQVTKATSPAGDDLYRCGRLALLASIRTAQARDADAAEALKQLRPFAEKMKPDADGPEGWPDLIAVLGTLDRPTLRPVSTDLADVLIKNLERTRDNPVAVGSRLVDPDVPDGAGTSRGPRTTGRHPPAVRVGRQFRPLGVRGRYEQPKSQPGLGGAALGVPERRRQTSRRPQR